MSDTCSTALELRRHTSMTGARFDEVLAAHDAQVRAEALREAARDFAEGEWLEAFLTDRVTDDASAVRATEAWFNRRADNLARDGGGEG